MSERNSLLDENIAVYLLDQVFPGIWHSIDVEPLRLCRAQSLTVSILLKLCEPKLPNSINPCTNAAVSSVAANAWHGVDVYTVICL